jgi:putative DNA primase/helicase
MKKLVDDNDLLMMGALPDDPFEDGYVISLPLPEPPPESVDRPRGLRCTDTGNGRRLVALYGRNIRYCEAMMGSGWIIWSGGRWVPDKKRQIREIAKTIPDDIRAEAADVEARIPMAETAEARDDLEGLAKALRGWATTSESLARIKSMVECASSEQQVATEIEEIDRNPWLFNAKNGTIDLRTGQLLHHEREHLITDITNVEYDPKAECPVWLRFLDQIMAGDREMVRFLRRAVGYSLLGITPEQVMFILVGHGRNGKSTFVNAVRRALGTYAKGTPAETLMAKREGAIPNDLAALASARFVSCSELAEGRRLDEALVKQLTGGEPVAARFLNREWFEYIPKYALWMSTNHKPIIRGTDLGIWRRLLIVEFKVTIAEGDVDTDLENKLRAELPGILAWAVKGCIDWQREGLSPPASVVAATKAYQQDMDLVDQFIEECCRKRSNAQVENGRLFEAFDKWRRRQAEPEKSHSWLTRRLKEKKYEQGTPGSGPRVWFGLELIDTNQPVLPVSGYVD